MAIDKFGKWMKLRPDQHAQYGEWGVWLEGNHDVQIGERIVVVTNRGKVLQVEIAGIIADGVQRSTGIPFKILATTGKKFYGPETDLL